MRHPETSLRQAATAVLLRVATTSSSAARGVGVPLPSGRGASTPEEEAVLVPPQCVAAYLGDDTPARVVLWTLVCSSSSPQHHQPFDSRAEQPARVDVSNGDGGSDGGRENGSATTAPSWQFREGVLLVFDGVLKHLVESRLAEMVSGGGVDEPYSTATRNDDGEEERKEEWPAELLDGTPSLGELLMPLLCQAEHALYEADLMRSMASHPQQQPGDDGSLELWRSGSQLLPTIARAMVWWNPRALFR